MLTVEICAFGLCSFMVVLVHIGVTPSATLMFACLKDEPPLPETTIFVKKAFVSIGMTLTILEAFCYSHITYELYTHDKLMRLVLREEEIRKRMRRNAISLFSHMCQFMLEISWLVIVVLCRRMFNSTAMLAPVALTVVQNALTSLLHIAMSPAKQTQIRLFCTLLKSVFSL